MPNTNRRGAPASVMNLPASSSSSSSRTTILASATIDPYVAQEMGRQMYDVQNVDWAEAAWDRIPALRNLQHLSELSRMDMHIPPRAGMCELMAGGPIGLTPERERHAPSSQVDDTSAAERAPTSPQVPNKVDDESDDDAAAVPVLHPAADALLQLSPEGRRVKRAEFLQVNEAVDLREVDGVENMCRRQRVPERLSRTILGMTQLLGLSGMTTANDEQLMDLVGAIADSNSDDTRIVQLMLKSGVKYNTTSLASLLDFRRHHTKYPNRGFHDSDIVAYPQMERWGAVKPSLHADERQTWQQRHLDIGAEHEDARKLENYQEELTTAEGTLSALLHRLDVISSQHSPFRDSQLRERRGVTDGEHAQIPNDDVHGPDVSSVQLAATSLPAAFESDHQRVAAEDQTVSEEERCERSADELLSNSDPVLVDPAVNR